MGKKPYRVEVNYPKTGKPKYFLVKDVKVKGKKRKARKYLGTTPPTAEDIDHYREKYAYQIELKAAQKRAAISSTFYQSQHLTQNEIKSVTYCHMQNIYRPFNNKRNRCL